MGVRETFKAMDELLRDWNDDPDTTTAEYVCVQFDLLVAAYLKRPPLTLCGDDEA